ncbi:MAG TPA: aminotransferase, partial [Micromonosporaceae bacterium]|nr:aminotransferase [Micromonosporaceae bacterium]
MTASGPAARPPRLTRSDLDALPSYVPGRNPADLARELGMPEAIKLASNEVPYGPLPGVVEAVTEAATAAHRYPDMGVIALRDTLADRLG